MSLKIAISVGEPAGIGPDIVLATLIQGNAASKFEKIVIVANSQMLKARAEKLNLNFAELTHKKNIEILDRPLLAPVEPGKLNSLNSEYVLNSLKTAAELAMRGEVDVLVTAPIHKGIINQAGIKFSGHTEFLRDLAGLDHVVMMLASDHPALRVALVTTHVPLSEVSQCVTPDLLRKTIRIIRKSFWDYFKLDDFKIGVCGLNPHAGENGHLGREEIEVIIPALKTLEDPEKIMGPLPADSLFSARLRKKFDVILAMYHDQGLAPFKALCFGEGVNITLGLPYLRVSVDHGTALELAGTGDAEYLPFEAVLNFVLNNEI